MLNHAYRKAWRGCFPLAALFFVFVLGVFGQANEPITKNGLVKALKARISNSHELAGYVAVRGVDFPLTPDAEAELKAAGATPELMEAIRAHYKGPDMPPPGPTPAKKVTPPPPPPPAPPTPAFAPGIYRKDGAQWVKILDEGVRWKKTSAVKKFTIGLGHGEMVGTVPGMSSPNLLKNPIVFVIALPEGGDIGRYMLVQMTPKKGSREIDVSPSGENSKNLVPFTSKRVGKNLYQVDFTQGSGDYGFLPPGKEAGGEMELSERMYTFRVVQ